MECFNEERKCCCCLCNIVSKICGVIVPLFIAIIIFLILYSTRATDILEDKIVVVKIITLLGTFLTIYYTMKRYFHSKFVKVVTQSRLAYIIQLRKATDDFDRAVREYYYHTKTTDLLIEMEIAGNKFKLLLNAKYKEKTIRDGKIRDLIDEIIINTDNGLNPKSGLNKLNEYISLNIGLEWDGIKLETKTYIIDIAFERENLQSQYKKDFDKVTQITLPDTILY